MTDNRVTLHTFSSDITYDWNGIHLALRKYVAVGRLKWHLRMLTKMVNYI